MNNETDYAVDVTDSKSFLCKLEKHLFQWELYSLKITSGLDKMYWFWQMNNHSNVVTHTSAGITTVKGNITSIDISISNEYAAVSHHNLIIKTRKKLASICFLQFGTFWDFEQSTYGAAPSKRMLFSTTSDDNVDNKKLSLTVISWLLLTAHDMTNEHYCKVVDILQRGVQGVWIIFTNVSVSRINTSHQKWGIVILAS
jgi:hypothetical protein